MIIEFTGAPCCGKSAVSHKLAEMLRADGFYVKEPSYDISHSTKKIKRVMIKAVRAFLYAVKHPSIVGSAHRYGSLGWCLNYLYICSFNKTKTICILDQGLCQCVASVFDNEKTDDAKIVKIFASLLPAETDRYQVFIRVNSDSVAQRMLKRDDVPYYESTGDVARAIENSIKTNAMLQKNWEEKYGSGSCVTISNDDDDNGNRAVGKLYEEIRMRGIL